MLGTVLDRFWSKVDRPSLYSCWEWQAGLAARGGYGQYRGDAGVPKHAHREAWERMVGPIPEGRELDHLCRNPLCVNPDHLEPVTHAENMRRTRGTRPAVTHCRNGHPKPQGRGRCAECKRLCNLAHYHRSGKTTVASRRGGG